MNEFELKRLFISSIKSNHIINNNIFPKYNKNLKLKIRNEACFRNFDLVLTFINKEIKNIEEKEIVRENIIMRTGQILQAASIEKCEIENISFYPIELKSDDDKIDERISNQVLNAILTFGRSIVVFDKTHYQVIKKQKILKMLPATIIGYTGSDDFFEVNYPFNRFVQNSIFNIPKKEFVRMLIENEITTDYSKIYQNLSILQKINQKIIYNYFFDSNVTLLENELEFLKQFVNIDRKSSEKKCVSNIIKMSKNNKIIDYM